MVEETVEGQVITLRLRRPERRNAIDRATAEALSDAFRRFEADPSLAVAVLTGEGSFCSGADLHELAAGRPNRIAPDGDAPLGPTRRRLSKVVVAAIEGYAVAGGLELALWCDLRVASEEAVLGVFCRRWGVPLIDGGTYRLPALIGLSRAMDLILTGRPVGAAEALAIGLVHRVVPTGQALAAAQALARSLADLPQDCLRADRASAYAGFGQDEAQALQAEFTRGAQVLEEAVSGARRFAAGAGRSGRAVEPPGDPASSPVARSTGPRQAR